MYKGTSLIQDIDLPCSPDESFIYNLWSTWASTAPSWIEFNNTKLQMSINAPNVNSDQEFDFYITSGPLGASNLYQTLIKLSVINCKVDNCLQCPSSILIWSEWKTGFSLVNGSWNFQNTAVRQCNYSEHWNNLINNQRINIHEYSMEIMIIIISLSGICQSLAL